MDRHPRREAVLDFSAMPAFSADGSTAVSHGPAPGRPLRFEAKQGKLFAEDKEFAVKGINWYGSEDRTGAPTGLDHHSIDWYMDFLAENQFNGIRLLFNVRVSDEAPERMRAADRSVV